MTASDHRHPGHRRDRRRRGGGGRAARRARRWRWPCAACGAHSGSCSASRASATWSPTRPRCRTRSRRCADYVEDVGGAPGRAPGGRRDGAARDDRAPRAGSLRRLQRAVRAAVDVDRAARRRPARGSCCRASTIATRRGCMPSRCATGAANWSSRRRRPRRCASRWSGRERSAGRCRRAARQLRAPARAAPRASAISARRAPSARRRCWRAREPDAVEPVALRTIYDTVMALARGRGRAGRSCRSRTRSRAR